MTSTHGNDDYDVEPYDPNHPQNEPHPDHIVYQKPFEHLKTQTCHAFGLLRDTLVASEYQNATTKGLLQEVHKRAKEDVDEVTMFAIVGDMGLGKSSLINSLLSVGTIARSGASGDSCTWVVQRFMKPFPDQGAPYAAKVFFFSEEEVRRIIASLVVKYFRAMDKTKQEDEEAETEELTSDKFTEKRTVLDIFKALFGDHPEFEDDEAAQRHLSNLTCENDKEMIDELTSWANDLAADYLDGRDCITIEASTAAELLYQLQPFTYQLSGGEGEGQISPWPMVNVVDFGLDNFLLRQNIVLVDTPGLSDSDSTRAANAIHHHRKCTHKITVADVGRAKNDKALRESLAQGYSLRGSAGNLLVLTKGDNIDGDTEVTGGRIEKQREIELLHEIKAFRDERAELMKRKRKLNKLEQFDIDEQLREIGAELRLKASEYDHLRACMRNDAVAKAVSAQYSELTGDPRPLSVHVVANNAYKKHQAGYAADEKPVLSVKQTGIPKLRAYIFCLPAEGILNEALHSANVQLPNLINFFELYCSKTHMARKTEIEAIILKPSNDIDPLLQKTLRKLRDAVESNILRPMKLTEIQWTKGARLLCQKWAEQHTKGGLAIMKNEGFKKGRKNVPEVSWNKDLLKIKCVKENLEDQFRGLQNGFVAIFDELGEQLVKLLMSTRTSIRGDPQFNVMALQPFLETFKIEKPNLVKRKDAAFKALRRDITNIQDDATTPSATAYLNAAMKPIYAEVIGIKGRGAPQKRMEMFEKKVTAMSGVWMKIHDNIETACDKAFAENLASIEHSMRDIFATIHKSFVMLCDDVVVKSPEEQKKDEELRAKLMVKVKETKALVNGEISTSVAECTGYAKKQNDSAIFMPED